MPEVTVSCEASQHLRIKYTYYIKQINVLSSGDLLIRFHSWKEQHQVVM